MDTTSDLRALDAALSAELFPSFLDELSDAELLPAAPEVCESPLDAELRTQTTSTPLFTVFSPSVDASPPLPTLDNAAAPVSTSLLPAASQSGAEMSAEQVPDARRRGNCKLPMQNSTRKRQREELNYLRAKVQMLEKELAARRRELMDTDGGEKKGARSLRWQRIAKRQLVEKQRAEMQNLQLRESLADQIKLAKSLQRLLKKNVAKSEASEVAQLQARLEFTNCPSGVSEEALYDNLLQDMDSVYAEVDSVCARHSIMRSLEEGSDVSSLHIGETEALYLEATNSKVVPFGMEETCSAVWRCLSRDHVKLADGTYHAVASSRDFIRAKAIMTLRVNSAQARMQMRFAMKKYVESGRMVLTLASASESEGPRDLLHGLKMMQRAWVIIRPVPVETESAEHMSDDPAEETIIQLCMRLTPSLSAGALEHSGQRTGAVTELLLAAVHRNLGWLFQTVENILMEHHIAPTTL